MAAKQYNTRMAAGKKHPVIVIIPEPVPQAFSFDWLICTSYLVAGDPEFLL